MPAKQFYRQIQSEMFNCQTLVLDLPDLDVEYWSDFINAGSASQLYQTVLEQTKWCQDVVTVYGKQHLTPRLSCWMGDAGLDYSYSNNTMHPQPWSKTLLEIKYDLEARVNETFNSVLINYYRDGQDSNGWHSDNEPELGVNPTIASLSLGAPRDFLLRHKHDKSQKHSLSLEHGSLLIMRGTTQSHWQHHIPKRARADGRINLTFRTVLAL